MFQCMVPVVHTSMEGKLCAWWHTTRSISFLLFCFIHSQNLKPASTKMVIRNLNFTQRLRSNTHKSSLCKKFGKGSSPPTVDLLSEEKASPPPRHCLHSQSCINWIIKELHTCMKHQEIDTFGLRHGRGGTGREATQEIEGRRSRREGPPQGERKPAGAYGSSSS